MTKNDASTLRLSDFDKLIAQKIALDIRFFCADEDKKVSTKLALSPVTTLPTALATMISETALGSVVLFAENFTSTEQVVKLTHDLQQAALTSSLAKPLILSVDQEGGRVVRFNKATAFSGNMAIGATYQKHQTKYAEQVNAVIAKELKVLGINNNYAPVVDVNTNSKNPVINTRSFGEEAYKVASLGIAAVNALQSEGVMATLKHFPGHGDTYIDSHIGLPRVEHDLACIEKIDLMPFSRAITQANPAMIMTAHIQYPALENSTFTSKTGEKHLRPATMSRKILTDLLRNKMSFNGIIATDALDMAGIAYYFEPVQAVVETFIAGADIAVMPFKVRNTTDITRFKLFIKSVSQALKNRIKRGEITAEELHLSLARINQYKADYITLPNEALEEKISSAQALLANEKHLDLEQQLSNAAVVLVKNKQAMIPLSQSLLRKGNGLQKLLLLVESKTELSALKYALTQACRQSGVVEPSISALVASDKTSWLNYNENALLNRADLVIATINVKTASLVDLGGVDDLVMKSSTKEKDKLTYASLMQWQLQRAKQNNVKSILIARGSPYLMAPYNRLVDVLLLNFDDRSYALNDIHMISPGYNTSLAVIFGQQTAQGELPVSL